MNFEMTRDEAADLAKFIERLRKRLPGDTWHRPGIEDALARARHRAPAPDLAVAAIKAAQVPTNRTPAVIGLDGPHWQGSTTPPRTDQPKSNERCSICSQREQVCRSRWSGDHDFESDADAEKRKAALDPEALALAVRAVRDGIVPTADPTPRPTLDDLAASDPKLHERVDYLRHLVQPMREPETPLTDEPTEETA